MSTVFHPPTVTPDDIAAFQKSHFSPQLHSYFASSFLPPKIGEFEVDNDEVIYEDPEEITDPGLGYYPDGVKRTLTDEQITIFRFSEIQGLLRQKRRNLEKRRKHKERKERKLAYDEEARVAAVAASAAEEMARFSAFKRYKPTSLEQHRKGRMETAICAAGLPWDEGDAIMEDDSAAKEEPVEREMDNDEGTAPQLDPVTGRVFLWPAIRPE